MKINTKIKLNEQINTDNLDVKLDLVNLNYILNRVDYLNNENEIGGIDLYSENNMIGFWYKICYVRQILITPKVFKILTKNKYFKEIDTEKYEFLFKTKSGKNYSLPVSDIVNLTLYNVGNVLNLLENN